MISLRLAFIFLITLCVSAQNCIKLTNCTECKQTSGCGYCDIPGGIGICFLEVSEVLCSQTGGRWNPSTCAPPVVSACLDATDCNTCLNNRNGCGWCGLGDLDIGVCHDSNATCNAMSGSWFTDKCPTGTNCTNYTACEDCQQDTNCMSCQITPTMFTCVSAAQRNLFCPLPFYRQNADCNVTAGALTCANLTSCEQCGQNPSCGWCNWGTARGGQCFRNEDASFCRSFGLWKQPCNQGTTAACMNVSDVNVTFCTELPNNRTDMPWILKLHDSYYSKRWKTIGSSVHDEVNGAGIGFCEDCWNAYKKFLCAAASPKCGMNDCYQTARTSATDCIAGCPCETMNEFIVQPSCYQCVMQCTSDAVTPDCGEFGLSKRTCKQLVNICGCNPSQQAAETICSDFSDNGVDVDLGNGTCTDVPTWCSLSSGNQTSNWTDVTNINASDVSPSNNSSAIPPMNLTSLKEPQPNKLCPNSHICLSVYNSLGADVIANPVTTHEGVDNNGNPGGTNGGGDKPGHNSAISKCASPLLLAALFLLIFV